MTVNYQKYQFYAEILVTLFHITSICNKIVPVPQSFM